MCGIAGILDFNKRSNLEQLKDMTDTMWHRGPDGSGYDLFVNDHAQVGLGHRRLSIIDLSANGKQPMHYKHLHITFNGEIYNYREIKDELANLGHEFVSGSDTEMILHAYEVWGDKCIEKFIGMFAFCLYDAQENTVFCVRDRAGIKPFFYYRDGDIFLFASELKAFHKHPQFIKRLNPNAVGLFMQFGNVPSQHCIFENCHKLNPGHSLKIDLKTREIVESKYWDVYDYYNKPKLDLSFEEAKDETRKIVTSAAEYRMVADVPVGVFLSGGYDSASLTAILQQDRSQKLKTFTIAVPDMGLNESEYARDVATFLGTDHQEFTCTHKEAMELIPDLPYYYDEPFADSSAIPTTLVCKMARKEVTVALSADAGDEVFAGYNRYDYMMKLGPKLNKVPSLFRNIGVGLMDAIPPNKIPVLKDKYNFSERYDKLKRILKNPSAEEIMLSLSSQYTASQLDDVLTKEFVTPYTNYQSKDLLEPFHSSLSYMLAIDYQTYLVDDILQKVDRASMTVSLEGREPYLDHRLIEFAAQLPDHFKYNNGSKKHILKEIVHDLIPRQMMERPKMGFAIPYDKWMYNELKTEINFYLDDMRIRQQGIFKPEYVQQLKQQFYSGKSELALKMWYLYMFQMWYERWMK